MTPAALKETCGALIGALLFDCHRVYPAVLRVGLTADMMPTQPLRDVFSAIVQEIQSTGSADLLLLTRLPPETLDGIGGHAAIEKWVELSQPANAARYCEEIRDAHRLERLRASAGQVWNDHDLTLTDASKALNDALFACMGENRDTTPRHVTDWREEKMSQWALAKGRGFVGIPSVFPTLNRYLGGYRPNVATVLGGYRGQGKSTLARQECYHIARDCGKRVLLFSLEDSGDIASAGVAGNAAGVSVFHLDIGEASDFQRDSIDSAWGGLKDVPLWIAAGSYGIGEIEAIASFHAARHGIDFLCLDHLQFIVPYQLPRMDRNGTVASYMQRMVALTRRLGCPALILSQLSRDGEKQERKPRLSDLRDSGAIEQDARAVLLLYFDPAKGCHVLEVAKNNNGISGKDIELVRLDGKQRFGERATEQQEAAYGSDNE